MSSSPRERSFQSVVITRERPDSADVAALIAELDAHLNPLYPPESRHGYSIAKLMATSVAFFVLRADDTPAGCGGIQLFGTEYGELKRMYVRPGFRSLGYGRLLLDHLTDYARAQGVDVLRLETGIHQTAALRLYEWAGFQRILPFGDYREDPLRAFGQNDGVGPAFEPELQSLLPNALRVRVRVRLGRRLGARFRVRERPSRTPANEWFACP